MTHVSDVDFEAAVRRLVDEADIRRVIVRFARGSDRMDIDMLRSCYHPDATDSHGGVNGHFEDFIAWSVNYNKKVVNKFHHLGQSLIEVDGDSAWAETYCVCYIRLRDEAGELIDRTGVIRYIDLFERRAGEWRIAHRKLVHEPGKVEPATEVPLAEKAFAARMDRDDPSFDRRPESFLP